jgi:hypothetical protein
VAKERPGTGRICLRTGSAPDSGLIPQLTGQALTLLAGKISILNFGSCGQRASTQRIEGRRRETQVKAVFFAELR